MTITYWPTKHTHHIWLQYTLMNLILITWYPIIKNKNKHMANTYISRCLHLHPQLPKEIHIFKYQQKLSFWAWTLQLPFSKLEPRGYIFAPLKTIHFQRYNELYWLFFPKHTYSSFLNTFFLIPSLSFYLRKTNIQTIEFISR